MQGNPRMQLTSVINFPSAPQGTRRARSRTAGPRDRAKPYGEKNPWKLGDQPGGGVGLGTRPSAGRDSAALALPRPAVQRGSLLGRAPPGPATSRVGEGRRERYLRFGGSRCSEAGRRARPPPARTASGRAGTARKLRTAAPGHRVSGRRRPASPGPDPGPRRPGLP